MTTAAAPRAGDAAAAADRDRVLALLVRHGWNAASFQLLAPSHSYWFTDDAVVGYVDTGGAWVAGGPPVCATERLAEVAAAFTGAAAAARRRVCWFGTEARFRDATGTPSLRVGEQPVWDPADWDGVLRTRRSLREQLRRARAKGVTTRALDPAEVAPGHPMRGALDRVIARWLATRPLAAMGFVVELDPFRYPTHRRYAVAEHAGRVVGLLAAVPIYARRGWMFEDLVRAPDAPNGTVELLVDHAMRAAAAEGATLATLGMVPLAGAVGRSLRAARVIGRGLYDFAGLRAFKAKLGPRAWDPIFISHPPGRGRGLRAVIDALTAFARGSLVRFALASAARRPGIVAAGLVLVALVGLLALWIART